MYLSQALGNGAASPAHTKRKLSNLLIFSLIDKHVLDADCRLTVAMDDLCISNPPRHPRLHAIISCLEYGNSASALAPANTPLQYVLDPAARVILLTPLSIWLSSAQSPLMVPNLL